MMNIEFQKLDKVMPIYIFKYSTELKFIISIPAHFPRLHFLVCCVIFPHPLPPPEGGGLVQVRVRVCTPLPQVALHAEYSDH